MSATPAIPAPNRIVNNASREGGLVTREEVDHNLNALRCVATQLIERRLVSDYKSFGDGIKEYHAKRLEGLIAMLDTLQAKLNEEALSTSQVLEISRAAAQLDKDLAEAFGLVRGSIDASKLLIAEPLPAPERTPGIQPQVHLHADWRRGVSLSEIDEAELVPI